MHARVFPHDLEFPVRKTTRVGPCSGSSQKKTLSFEPLGRRPMALGGHGLVEKAAELQHLDHELQLGGLIHRAQPLEADLDAHRPHDERGPAADIKMSVCSRCGRKKMWRVQPDPVRTCWRERSASVAARWPMLPPPDVRLSRDVSATLPGRLTRARMRSHA